MAPAAKGLMRKAQGYQPFAAGGNGEWEMGNGIVREASPSAIRGKK
jgi:hypothetical protein